MASTYKGLILKLGIDGSEMLTGLEKANKELKGTQAELNTVKKLLKSDWSMERYQRAQELAKKRTEETGEKVKILKKAIAELEKQGVDKTSDEFKALQNELDKAEISAINARKQLNEINNLKLDRIQNSIKGVSDKIEGVGKKLMPLSAAILGIGAASIKAMDNVDQGLDAVYLATGATGDQAKELQKIYEDVAAQIPADFQSIGGALGEVNTRLGFTGQELDTATQDFLKFSKVAGVDAVEGVRLVSRAMGDAGIDTADYKGILDSLAKAAQASGIDIATLAGNITKYGAPMRALGMDAKESIAIFAGWEKAGVNTEIAFSGMKKAIGTWGKEGKDAREEFGKTLQQIESAPDIAEATALAIEAFGQKAGPDLADAIQNGKFEYQEFLNIIEGSQGTVESTYAMVIDEVDDTQLAMQNLQLALHDTGETIAKTLGPVFLEFANWIKDVCARFDELDDGQKKTVLRIVGLAASIGPLLIIVGKLGQGISAMVGAFKAVKTALVAFKAANQAATLSQAALNAVMNANPFVLLATVIGVAVAAIAGYNLIAGEAETKTSALKKEVDELKSSYESAQKSIDDSSNSALAQVDAASKLIPRLEELANKSDKTAVEQAEMKRIVDQLNTAIPGLQLSINNETGALNMQTAAVWRAVDAYKALLLAKVAAQKMEAAISQKLDLQKKLDENLDNVSIEDAQKVARAKRANAGMPGTDWKALGFKNIGDYLATKDEIESQNALDDELRAEMEKVDKDIAYWEEKGKELGAAADSANAYKYDSGNKGTGGGGGGSGGKGGGGTSGGAKSSSAAAAAAKAAEDARKKRVDAYLQNIEDTEEWNLNYYQDKKDAGQLTSEQELKSLEDRAARYRKYAEEIVKIDYMTAEEKSNAAKEYLKRAKAAEKEAAALQVEINKELAKKYEDDIAERERLDLRYAEQKKAYGELTEEQEAESIRARAERYRKYADEVLTLEYMTEEEKLRLRQEYTEKAEDLELEHYEYMKSLSEKRIAMMEEERDRIINAAQSVYEAKKQHLEELENKELESIRKRAEAEEELLQQKLEAIDEEIEARRRLREDEDQEDKIAKIQKQITAAKAELAYARDADSAENLQREIMRLEQSLADELQNKEDTEFERQKQAEKDAINEQIEELRKRTEAEQEAARQKYAAKNQTLINEQAAYESQVQRNADRILTAAPYINQSGGNTNVTNNDNRQGVVVVQQVESPAKMAEYINKAWRG